MKTLLRSVVALVVLLSAGAAAAQNLAGNWQGTLQAGPRSLRIIFAVTAADAGGLRAVMYSIDQGGQGIPATVTAQGLKPFSENGIATGWPSRQVRGQRMHQSMQIFSCRRGIADALRTGQQRRRPGCRHLAG